MLESKIYQTLHTRVINSLPLVKQPRYFITNSVIHAVYPPRHPNSSSRAFITSGRLTYVAVVVQQVVGEFEFVEGDDLLHPLRAFGRRVRVIVHPARRGGVRLAGDQPRRAVESVPSGHRKHVIRHKLIKLSKG